MSNTETAQVSRDPGDYEPTVHARQMQRDRNNPTIPWETVADVIRSGDVETQDEKNAGAYRFREWVEIGIIRHEVTVAVGLDDTDSWRVLSVYCHCHGENTPCYRRSGNPDCELNVKYRSYSSR